eukprot:4518300-Prymnesium_polylepis.1
MRGSWRLAMLGGVLPCAGLAPQSGRPVVALPVPGVQRLPTHCSSARTSPRRRLPPLLRMGLFDMLWPSSPAVAAAVEAICCEGGWDVRCTLGSSAARGLRSRAEDRSGGLLPAAMHAGVGSRFMAQGAVRLLSTSRYLSASTEASIWKVVSTDDDEVPTAIRWSLQSGEIAVGGDTFVPQGPVYFTAFTTAERRQRGLDVGSGRVTIREDSSVLSALFGTQGLIEEFKTVGSFAITPRSPASGGAALPEP